MKVLIPIDGSKCSQNTLAWAAQSLNKEQTQFVLIHIIPSGIPELVTEVYQVEDALKVLDDARTYLTAQGLNVLATEYLEGDPVESICRMAEDLNVDQVLMGSHGRSGLIKMLLGSVSSGVMEKCKKPVFIYRNHENASVSASV
ncbi:MAG: universal stress protein [Vampirovibrio sp.]|nr:universal stress protein [Vampirovibrio sp.]